MIKKVVGPNFLTKFAAGGVVSIGVGFSSWHFFPNTVFIDKLKEIVQLYRSGVPVPVPQELAQQFDTVLSDLKIKHKSLIKPFTVYGFDMFHAGSTASKYGALIGIPSNFFYHDIKDVETNLITIQNATVNWVSKEGCNFKKSLVFSEKAKAYLLAREMLMVDSPLMYLRCVYPIGVSLVVYTAAYHLNQKLRLLQRPFLIRGIMYVIVGLFGLGSWAFLQDFSTSYYEAKADKEVCALGKKYIEGGLEAYSKILQRNISLRELMGAKGSSIYTASGNDVTFLRIKHLPLTLRKEYVENQLKRAEGVCKDDSQALPDTANTL